MIALVPSSLRGPQKEARKVHNLSTHRTFWRGIDLGTKKSDLQKKKSILPGSQTECINVFVVYR